MDVMVTSKTWRSTYDGHQLNGKVYIPEISRYKGVFHVVHGMTEYIGRYDSFMRRIAEEGYVCFAYDHLGHGDTATDDSELGFIAEKDGWKYLVGDVLSVGNEMRNEYKGIPYYLLGHSMGSFIVRLAASGADIPPDKLIVMGTGGPQFGAGLGVFIAKILGSIHGPRSYSSLIEKMAFGSYNKKFGDDDKYNWLTKDPDIRKAYAADKYCTFHFTVSALQDLVRLNIECNKKECFSSTDKKNPVLIVSGGDDPVGNYGKGPEKVCDLYKKYGVNASVKLYNGCRHEILNDTCREEVISDISDFINK